MCITSLLKGILAVILYYVKKKITFNEYFFNVCVFSVPQKAICQAIVTYLY